MSHKLVSISDLDKLPAPLQDHARRCKALGEKVLEVVNGAGETSNVVLDVLLNLYTNAAKHSQRELECAHNMTQIGAEIILRHAMQQQAAGIDPMAAPNVH